MFRRFCHWLHFFLFFNISSVFYIPNSLTIKASQLVSCSSIPRHMNRAARSCTPAPHAALSASSSSRFGTVEVTPLTVLLLGDTMFLQKQGSSFQLVLTRFCDFCFILPSWLLLATKTSLLCLHGSWVPLMIYLLSSLNQIVGKESTNTESSDGI